MFWAGACARRGTVHTHGRVRIHIRRHGTRATRHGARAHGPHARAGLHVAVEVPAAVHVREAAEHLREPAAHGVLGQGGVAVLDQLVQVRVLGGCLGALSGVRVLSGRWGAAHSTQSAARRRRPRKVLMALETRPGRAHTTEGRQAGRRARTHDCPRTQHSTQRGACSAHEKPQTKRRVHARARTRCSKMRNSAPDSRTTSLSVTTAG